MAEASWDGNEDTQENYDLETSRKLNSILNDIGLTKKKISNRRYNMQIHSLLIHLLDSSLLKYNGISYLSGSKAECVVPLTDQSSDTDIMYISSINVFNDIDQINNQVKHFPIQNGVYILEDSISHCLFKRLRYMSGENFNPHYLHDNGYIYLSHINIFNQGTWDTLKLLNGIASKICPGVSPLCTVEKSGPSIAISASVQFVPYASLSCKGDSDLVNSVFCPFWPNEINEFFVRHRPQQWPTPRDLDLIIRNGCHLVAKGFEGSIEYNIEWRLSFSFAENILIRSLNNIQMKCYFLLKKFLKKDIKPRFPELLCSYHMKTVMFWVCEEIGPNPFKQQFLLKCFRLCIERIGSYLLVGHFPCYFACESNLLSQKVPSEAYRKLAEFLSIVYHEETTTTVAGYLKAESQLFKRIFPFEANLPKLYISITARVSMALYLGFCERKTAQEVQSILNWLIIDVIKRSLLHAYPEWNVMNMLRQIVFPDISFTSIAFLRRGQLRNKVHYALQKQYLQLMTDELAVTHSNGLLKRATVYYKTGQFTRCMVIAVNVINLLTAKQAICVGAHTEEIIRALVALIIGKKYYITPNVTFSEPDKPLVPEFVVEEINFDEQIGYESTKGWAFLDSVIYAYGLAIICQHEQSDFAARDQFLQELQYFFLQNKHRVAYHNSVKRIIDHFNGQFYSRWM